MVTPAQIEADRHALAMPERGRPRGPLGCQRAGEGRSTFPFCAKEPNLGAAPMTNLLISLSPRRLTGAAGFRGKPGNLGKSPKNHVRTGEIAA
jgi:hypothetical protein